MAKANLKAVPTETLPLTHRLLNDIAGDFETDHLQAAEGIEVIAELLFDNFQHEEHLTELHVAKLCCALKTIAKWQKQETYMIAQRADDAMKELGVQS